MNTLGSNLKHYRRVSMVKQNELSKLSGVSKNYISDIEQGKKNNITICILCSLCKSLKITPNDLIPECLYKENTNE